MKLEFNFTKFIEFKNPFEGETYMRLKRTLIGTLQFQKDRVFESQADPDGTAWASLSKKTIAQRKKGRKGGGVQILRDTGDLMRSITTNNAAGSMTSTVGDEVVLGSNLPYAAIQNFGGQIQIPLIKNGFGLDIEIPAHTVTIPARPFIGFGNNDNVEITETIEGFLRRQNK